MAIQQIDQATYAGVGGAATPRGSVLSLPNLSTVGSRL